MIIKPTTNLSRRRFMAASGAFTTSLVMPGLAASASDYQESGVADPGKISGQIVYKSDPPAESKVLISKDNHHCGDGHVNPDPTILTTEGQVYRAVVAIEKISSGKPWQSKPDSPQIVQEKCTFKPYIQVARKLAELTIINKDPLLHNIHTYELIGRARRSMFNIAQPQAGQIDKQSLKTRRSNLIEIDCDAHNWMSAWIYLSDHPYVAITDEQGRYTLDNVPPGEYSIITWHPVIGKGVGPANVSPNSSLTLDIEINA